jgi:glycosyltransferase involved in cell wall biosynthesis
VTITSRRWWTEMPRRGYQFANRYAHRMSHMVIANSPAVARLVTEREGVDPSKVKVISNFVDDTAFDILHERERTALRTQLGIPENAIVATVVANFRPEKDLLSVVRATANLSLSRPELHLLLVGEGPCEASLRMAVQQLGISKRVHFAGFLSSPPNPHQLGDISVLCSLHEAFPNSVIEAMAAGRPVVATAVGGVGDAVQHETTGLLVPPSAPVELAAAIERLVTDPYLRTRLGHSARQQAKVRYKAANVIGELSNLYLASAVQRRKHT